jgi:hypothetical protein
LLRPGVGGTKPSHIQLEDKLEDRRLAEPHFPGPQPREDRAPALQGLRVPVLLTLAPEPLWELGRVSPSLYLSFSITHGVAEF